VFGHIEEKKKLLPKNLGEYIRGHPNWKIYLAPLDEQVKLGMGGVTPNKFSGVKTKFLKTIKVFEEVFAYLEKKYATVYNNQVS
jgi:hypothetical protein